MQLHTPSRLALTHNGTITIALEWSFIVIASLALIIMPQLKLAALNTSFYDLGQYVTILHRIALHGEWGWVLRGHTHLLAFPYAWIYAASPGPAGILAAQSTVVVATAWLAGRLWQEFSAGRPTTGAVIYLLSLPVWSSALFDFHFEHQLMPLLLGALLLAHRPGPAALCGTVVLSLALCLVKEVYALTAACMGLYLVLGRRHYVIGSIVIIISALYFKLMTSLVIPYFTDGKGSGVLWDGAFGYLGHSMSEIISTLMHQPLLPFFELVLYPDKLVFFLAIAASLGFVFLRRPLMLLPALPVLLTTALSRNPNHAVLLHQYTTSIVMVGFAAAAAAIGDLDERGRKLSTRFVLAGSCIILVMFGQAPISQLFVLDMSWNYGVSAYIPTERDRLVRALVAEELGAAGKQPIDELVIATQNSLFVPETGNAALLVAFPEGVFEPTNTLASHMRGLPALILEALTAPTGNHFPTRMVAVDTVILDLKRPCFIRDQGCSTLLPMQEQLAEGFRVAVDKDGLMIYRRR